MNNFLTAFGRYKRLVVILGIGIVFGFVAIEGIKAILDKIVTKKDEIAKAEERLEKLTTKENILKSEDRENLALEEAKLNEAIPSVIDLPLILAILQKISADTGTTLGDFSISSNTQAITILPVQRAEKLSAFKFKVNLTGGFDATASFIEKLERISPIFRVENVTFLGNASNIIVQFYFQPSSLKTKFEPDESLGDLTAEHKKTIKEVFVLETLRFEEPSLESSSANIGQRRSPFR